MAEKARLRRKDIKQPDEFLSLTAQGLTWVRQHQQVVTWAGAGLLGILVMVGIVSAYRAAQVRDANADLSRALTKLTGKDYRAAAAELIDVSTRWEGTAVAPLAALLAANAAVDAGDADAAVAQLTRLQSQTASLPPYLQQQVLVVWGAALEGQGQWLEAAAKYKDAAAMTGPYTGGAVLGEARTRELGGEPDRAKELYRQAYEQFPELPGREVIATRF